MSSARAIQELAGHVDLTTTQRYIHLSPAASDAAIQLLDPRGFSQDFGEGMEKGPSAQKRDQ
jgi:integrase